MEDKIKHLEFIQNIVTRMNTNSFQIKSLAITIVAALLAVYASNKNIDFFIIGIVPSFIFWLLDAYYLQQERKFKGLYNDVAEVTKESKKIKPFEMRPDLYVGGSYSYLNVLLSKTIWPIYTLMIVGLLISHYYLS